MKRLYQFLPVCSPALQKGFTLLELLIVLIVIGVAAGIAGLMVARDPGGLELRTTAKDISAVLRYARNHAVSEKKDFVFEVDEEDRVYRLLTEKSKKISAEGEPGEDAGEMSEDTASDDEDNSEIVVISKEIPEGLEVTFHESDEEIPELVFSPQGHSSGALIKVSSDTEKAYYIKVNRITGKVVIEEEN
ncbi:MAG: prepilin-type N-terminal cleavage/methylation domain-containing protein [Nitrospiraceae bacterium]|nr:MAG: prepilin-type N-terminal cleavage/methylation domain-containing protein [Nitrospiraceae bacterium]